MNKILLALLLLVNIGAQADINKPYTDDGTVTIRWDIPTQYSDNTNLLPENYVKTIIERSVNGQDYDVIGETNGATTQYIDLMSGILPGEYSYRVFAVATDPNLPEIELKSSASNVTVARLFMLRGIGPLIIQAQ